jgi:hypothetical protein
MLLLISSYINGCNSAASVGASDFKRLDVVTSSQSDDGGRRPVDKAAGTPLSDCNGVCGTKADFGFVEVRPGAHMFW